MGIPTNSILFDADGDTDLREPVRLIVNTIDENNDWFIGTQEFIVDYDAPSPANGYRVLYTGCCRLSSIRDNNNDDRFGVEATIKLLPNVPFAQHNRSPRVTALPIITLPQSSTPVTFNIPAVDADGDVVSFAISTKSRMTNFMPSQGNFQKKPHLHRQVL